MRYRLRRPYRPWKGYVVEVHRRELTLFLGPDGWKGHDVFVEFPRSLMWDARPGQRVSLVAMRLRTVLADRPVLPVTLAELVEYRERARVWASGFVLDVDEAMSAAFIGQLAALSGLRETA